MNSQKCTTRALKRNAQYLHITHKNAQQYSWSKHLIRNTKFSHMPRMHLPTGHGWFQEDQRAASPAYFYKQGRQGIWIANYLQFGSSIQHAHDLLPILRR